jgi:hypothetical protein
MLYNVSVVFLRSSRKILDNNSIMLRQFLSKQFANYQCPITRHYTVQLPTIHIYKQTEGTGFSLLKAISQETAPCNKSTPYKTIDTYTWNVHAAR